MVGWTAVAASWSLWTGPLDCLTWKFWVGGTETLRTVSGFISPHHHVVMPTNRSKEIVTKLKNRKLSLCVQEFSSWLLLLHQWHHKSEKIWLQNHLIRLRDHAAWCHVNKENSKSSTTGLFYYVLVIPLVSSWSASLNQAFLSSPQPCWDFSSRETIKHLNCETKMLRRSFFVQMMINSQSSRHADEVKHFPQKTPSLFWTFSLITLGISADRRGGGGGVCAPKSASAHQLKKTKSWSCKEHLFLCGGQRSLSITLNSPLYRWHQSCKWL